VTLNDLGWIYKTTCGSQRHKNIEIATHLLEIGVADFQCDIRLLTRK